MDQFITSNPEWCSDHLLVIMHEILHLAAELNKNNPSSPIPQQVFDQLLVNFKAFCKLLSESDVSIVEGASYTMLAFIHFSMIQGINSNPKLQIVDEQLKTILPAFKLEKQIVAKNLLKSLESQQHALNLKKHIQNLNGLILSLTFMSHVSLHVLVFPNFLN